jgi:TonB family protein
VLLIGGLALAAWIGPRLLNQHATQQAPSSASEQEISTPAREPAAAAPKAAQPTPSAPDAKPGEKENDVTENGQVAPQAVAPTAKATLASPQPEAGAAPSAAANPPQTALKGEVLNQVLPDVPQSARDTIQGTIRVSVTVHVDAAGEVAGAEITSAGPSTYFADLALKAAQQWKFNPAEAGGRSVASTWILRFEFARDATRVIPTEEPL